MNDDKNVDGFPFFKAATDTATAPTSAPSLTTQTEAAVTVPLMVGERLPQGVLLLKK